MSLMVINGVDKRYWAGFRTTGIACCGAPFGVLSAVRQASPSFRASLLPFALLGNSKREGAVLHLFTRPHPLILLQKRRTVLHYKSKLHIYHIIFISLLNIFEESEYYQHLRKAGAVLCSSPLERLGEAASSRSG